MRNKKLIGSYRLVLKKKEIVFFNKVAKRAFNFITSKSFSSTDQSLINLSSKTSSLTKKKRLNLKKLSGVYIIINVLDGKCIVGQTTDLAGRFRN